MRRYANKAGNRTNNRALRKWIVEHETTEQLKKRGIHLSINEAVKRKQLRKAGKL